MTGLGNTVLWDAAGILILLASLSEAADSLKDMQDICDSVNIIPHKNIQ